METNTGFDIRNKCHEQQPLGHLVVFTSQCYVGRQMPYSQTREIDS